MNERPLNVILWVVVAPLAGFMLGFLVPTLIGALLG
jgi:hypothetical protein